MNIFGISYSYHDSAACLVRDGNSIAATHEERFTRKKHDPRFPKNAVRYCLEENGYSLTILLALLALQFLLLVVDSYLNDFSIFLAEK